MLLERLKNYFKLSTKFLNPPSSGIPSRVISSYGALCAAAAAL